MQIIIEIIISSVFAFLAGIGIGGGSLLILYLTIIAQMPYPQARVINLLFFLPSAIIATVLRRKQGQIKIKPFLPAIIAGSVSAVIFSILGNHIDTSIVRKLFGGLLIFVGIRELFYQEKSGRNQDTNR